MREKGMMGNAGPEADRRIVIRVEKIHHPSPQLHPCSALLVQNRPKRALREAEETKVLNGSKLTYKLKRFAASANF